MLLLPPSLGAQNTAPSQQPDRLASLLQDSAVIDQIMTAVYGKVAFAIARAAHDTVKVPWRLALPLEPAAQWAAHRRQFLIAVNGRDVTPNDYRRRTLDLHSLALRGDTLSGQFTLGTGQRCQSNDWVSGSTTYSFTIAFAYGSPNPPTVREELISDGLPCLSVIPKGYAAIALRLADSSTGRIIESGHRSDIIEILRQVARAASRARLDSIANGLVDRALTRPNRIGLVEEVMVLSEAGASGLPGAPYLGAAAALIRIHREAPSYSPLRRRAILHLGRVLRLDTNRQYLRSIATSSDPTADEAMRSLVIAATPGSMFQLSDADRQLAVTALRILWERASVMDTLRGPPAWGTDLSLPVPSRDAYARLRWFAGESGWIKP